VETAIDLARPKIIEHCIDVSVRGDERPVVVLVDEQLLGQAVLNLVLNAVEAMEAGGRLDVQYSAARAQDGARQLRLVIRDAGPGIPASILDRIFNPFFTTKEAGTGLGLAIVHRVVDAHDGTITASNPPGGGAQFEIRI
jgi:signal transduction histidine kinase